MTNLASSHSASPWVTSVSSAVLNSRNKSFNHSLHCNTRSLFCLPGGFVWFPKQSPQPFLLSAAGDLCNYIQSVPLSSTLDIAADIHLHSPSSFCLSASLRLESSCAGSVRSCLVMCVVLRSRWRSEGWGRDERRGRMWQTAMGGTVLCVKGNVELTKTDTLGYSFKDGTVG